MEICIAHDDNYLRKRKGTTLIRTIEVGGLDGFSRRWFGDGGLDGFSRRWFGDGDFGGGKKLYLFDSLA
jgi:hypothetical protein